MSIVVVLVVATVRRRSTTWPRPHRMRSREAGALCVAPSGNQPQGPNGSRRWADRHYGYLRIDLPSLQVGRYDPPCPRRSA